MPWPESAIGKLSLFIIIPIFSSGGIPADGFSYRKAGDIGASCLMETAIGDRNGVRDVAKEAGKSRYSRSMRHLLMIGISCKRAE